MVEIITEKQNNEDFALNFTTSSAISRVSIKFLVIYLPIFWLSGLMLAICWYGFVFHVNNWIIVMLMLPLAIFCSYFIS